MATGWRSATGTATTTATHRATRRASAHGPVPQSSAARGTGAADLSHHDDPPDAPRGAGAEQSTDRAADDADQPDQPTRETEDRGGPDDRGDQQVGRHRDQADLPRQRRHHRRTGQLRRRRNRHRLGQPARHPPAQRVAPPGGEQDDAARRHRRQGEAGREGQAGVDQQQRHHRQGQAPQSPPTTVGCRERGARRSPSQRLVRRSARCAPGAGTPRCRRAATSVSHRPRTPHHRATTSRNPTISVRLVPDTAVRWVSPVVRKSSSRPGSSPRSSPSTRAGTSACCAAGRWATDVTDRGADSRGAAPPDVRGREDLRHRCSGEQRGDLVVVGRREPPGGRHPRPQGHRLPAEVPEHEHRGGQAVATGRARSPPRRRGARPPGRRTGRRCVEGPGSPPPPPAPRTRSAASCATGPEVTASARTSAEVSTARATSTPAASVAARPRRAPSPPREAGQQRPEDAGEPPDRQLGEQRGRPGDEREQRQSQVGLGAGPGACLVSVPVPALLRPAREGPGPARGRGRLRP